MTEIRITDDYTKSLIQSEQERRRDKTPTKTAARMIAEYYAILEDRRKFTRPAPRRRPSHAKQDSTVGV